MKKRVRIYKPVNKFDEGGAQMQTPAQPKYTDEQLVSAMMQMMGDESNPLSLDEAQATIADEVGDQKAMILRNQVENWIEEQQIMDRANIANDDEVGEDMFLRDKADELAAQEEAAAEAEHDARMQQMYYDDSYEQDYSDDDQQASELIARHGGYLPHSRYGSNVSRLLRKQDGGPGQPQPQPEPQKKYTADSTARDLRAPYDPKTYAALLQNNANKALIKTDLEALAAAAKQQQLGQFTGSDPNAPVEDSDFDMMPEAQFGGAGRQRRMERRMNRRVNKMVGQIPAAMYDKRSGAFPSQFNIVTLPQGMTQNIMPARGYVNDGVKLANIDVRRTGLFGRPKEYSITFAQEAYTNPQVRQDVIKQEQNNKAEEVKDQAAEDKAKDQSTESSNNAAVKNAETPTTANEEADVKLEDIQVVSGRGARTNTAAANTSEVAVDENEESEQVQEGRTQNEQPVDPANMKIDYNRYFPGAKQIDQNKYKNMSLQDEINNYLEGEGRDVYDPEYSYTYNSKGQPIAADKYTRSKLKETGEKPTWQTWDPDKGGYQQFVMFNDKLYKRFTNGTNPTEWNEVTDPQRIRTVTTSMKEAGYKPEGGQKPINFKATSNEVFTSKTYGDSGYVFRNGKLYKAPKYASQGDGKEQWYEVTDPTRIATIKRDMQKQGMKVPGAMTKSPLTNPLDMVKGVTDSPLYRAGQFLFDQGGFTDASNPDLYRFVYGGDDPAIPMLGVDPYEYQSKNVNDPYFAYGGLTAYQDKGETDEGTTDEGTDATTTTEETTTDAGTGTTETISSNRKKYDALNELSVIVGDYQEGIDYSKLNAQGKGRQTEGPKTQGYSPYAMYPPVFNRQDRAAGRRAKGTNFFGGPKGIQYAGSWMQQQGLPFDPRTGKTIQAAGNLPLTKIDVTKTGMFGRKPKEYTMYFGNYGQAGNTAPQTKAELDAQKNIPAARDANKLNRRNRFAETLMHIPGLRKAGARMYEDPNLPLPEGTQYTTEQNPSLPLRPLQSNLGQEELVADQYNKMNEPKLDMEGLKDVEVPEVTPEEFSFADQQRFGNVQGPLNQEEATGMGSLPMRPLSNIPTQYDDQLMASNFNYSPQGMLKAADIDELQRFIPQPQGAITEEGYANELDLLGFPDAAPVMRDISGNAIQPGQGTPMNIAGPMSDMSNLPDEQGYFNDLQLEQNQEQRIANLPPESASYDYYQDVMQPNRDRSEYDFSTDQMLTPEERAQQAQENLEGFDPMRLPDESGSMPEPWMTQGKVDAQQARIRIAENRRLRQQEAAAKKRAEEKIRKEREQRQQQPNNSDNTQGNTQQTNTGNAQQVTPKKVNNNGTIDYGKNASIEDIYNDLIYKYTWGEVEAGFDEDTGIFDMKKVEKYRKDLEEQQKKWAEEEAYRNSPEGKQKEARELRKQDTEYIKELKIPIYANYKTREDLFKAIQAGHVKSPETVSKNWDKLDDNQRRQKELDVKLLNQEYERWLMSNTDDARNLNASGSVKLTGMDVMINGVSYPEVLIKGKRYYRKKSGGVDVFVPIKKMGGATLPMAQPGMITTANPNYVGLSDADMLDAQSYSQYFGNANNVSGNWWTGSPNIPRAQYGLNTAGANKYGYGYDPNSMDSEETQFKNWWNSQDKAKTDAMLADQEKELEAMNAYDVDLDAENKSMDAFANDSIGNNNPFAVKMKRKDMYNVDFPVIWGQAKGLAGMAGNIFKEATEGRENTRNMLRNTYAETMEPTNQRLDLGNWTKHSGAYIPKDTGFDFDRQDRKAKGGSMGDGQVTYMSAAQVKKFLAEGGELEFI